MKNPEGVKGKRKQEVKENRQEHKAVKRVQRENIRSGRKADMRFKKEGETGALR